MIKGSGTDTVRQQDGRESAERHGQNYVWICASVQPDLRMAEYEHYQGIYCSLCKQLGKSYGLLSRFTLSYDFTFLALFRMALDEKCAGFKKGRCLFNPLKKRTCCCDNDSIRFAADAASILVYYKIKDNIADNGFFSSIPARFLLPFASRARKKAAGKHKELDELIADCMREQERLEADRTESIDAAAEPTANPVGFGPGLRT